MLKQALDVLGCHYVQIVMINKAKVSQWNYHPLSPSGSWEIHAGRDKGRMENKFSETECTYRCSSKVYWHDRYLCSHSFVPHCCKLRLEVFLSPLWQFFFPLPLPAPFYSQPYMVKYLLLTDSTGNVSLKHLQTQEHTGNCQSNGNTWINEGYKVYWKQVLPHKYDSWVN